MLWRGCRKYGLGAQVLMVCCLLSGCYEARDRGSAPCPTTWPAGLDPERILVFALQVAPPPNARYVVFEQDLQELLLAGRYQIVPAASESAESWPLHCVRNRLEVTIEGSLKERQGRLVLHRNGKVQLDLIEHEPGDREPALAKLRFALAASLGLNRGPESLSDPASKAYEARLRALQKLAEGQVGEAAEILRDAVDRFSEDAALQSRLAGLLTAWAEEMQSPRHFHEISGPGVGEALPRLDAVAQDLLEDALQHHEQAARLGGVGPLHHLGKAQTLMALGRPRAAEEQLGLALAEWPAQSEAILSLARLRLERGSAIGLSSLLTEALSLVDRRATGSKAELLAVLGHVELTTGNPAGAVEAWKRALLIAPIERRSLRSELEQLLAKAGGRGF